jgi:hypothetical protein
MSHVRKSLQGTIALCGAALLVSLNFPIWAADPPCGCGKQAIATAVALAGEEAGASVQSSERTLGGYICPIYIYANHGTYCDWYALKCPEFRPQSYPTSCTRPPAPGCSNYSLCDAVPGEASEARSVLIRTNKHQGVDGYGKEKLKKKSKEEITAQVLKSARTHDTQYVADAVVAFPLKNSPNSPIVHAQIIVASVTPSDKKHPPVLLATAYEIEPPTGVQAENVTVVERPTGRPHAITVLWGSIAVDVITHEKTKPDSPK